MFYNLVRTALKQSGVLNQARVASSYLHLWTPASSSAVSRFHCPLENATTTIPSIFFKRGSSRVERQTVKHDPKTSTFYVEVEGNGRAFLEYERKDNHIKILHTEIPSALEGTGLGKVIAKEALEYVAKNNLSLEIECDFVLHYVNRYEPKYLKFIEAKDF